MAFITWNDEYSIGVAIFDDDHKKLIDGLNKLYDELCCEAPAAELEKSCDWLIEHTVAHCRREEAFFDDFDYPRAAAHRAMHEQLKLRATQFRQEIARHDSVSSLRFLREFLTHHIQGEDKRFGAHLNAKGIL
ncbi:MAG: hemerythrin family protein [Alphaproteobacteria bacterium]|nr:hemerythrin family protein [Alphaproteobacteria bacterium]